MNREQIIEGNQLIAEFMGGKYKTVYNGVDNSQQDYFFMPNDTIDNPRMDFEHDLPYHKSWDWLMPVYQEISRIWVNDTRPKQKEWEDTYRAIQNRLGLNQIFGMWQLVVHFIQWYNSNASTDKKTLDDHYPAPKMYPFNPNHPPEMG